METHEWNNNSSSIDTIYQYNNQLEHPHKYFPLIKLRLNVVGNGKYPS